MNVLVAGDVVCNTVLLSFHLVHPIALLLDRLEDGSKAIVHFPMLDFALAFLTFAFIAKRRSAYYDTYGGIPISSILMRL
jgi:hypothetical protein